VIIRRRCDGLETRTMHRGIRSSDWRKCDCEWSKLDRMPLLRTNFLTGARLLFSHFARFSSENHSSTTRTRHSRIGTILPTHALGSLKNSYLIFPVISEAYQLRL